MSLQPVDFSKKFSPDAEANKSLRVSNTIAAGGGIIMAHGGPQNSKKFPIVLALFQVAFIILFGCFAEYHYDALPAKVRPTTTAAPQHGQDANATATAAKHSHLEAPPPPEHTIDKPVRDFYPMFQDVHVMMFIGFGYLMTFLRKYGFSSLGINFLLAAFVIQWATLMHGFLHMEEGRYAFRIDMTTLLTSDFSAAVILITFGAVLGKLSPLQYIIMAFIEVAVFTVNEWIGLHYFKALDVGGSIFVHVFGAYFGLAVTRMLHRWEYGVTEFNTLKFTTKTTDLFSMVGTIFLWMFWPSFNSAVANGAELQQRAIINTYFCLASCCVVTFICSYLFHHGKFSMELVQNATLAGGVAIGSTADMMLNPYGALIIGAGAGLLSCVGFHYINSFLESKLKVHDTCGVNNLHGMPGILAALISAVVCATASDRQYHGSLYTVFPALESGIDSHGNKQEGRSPMGQAGYQLAALGLTLAMATIGGIITGLIIRMKIWDPLPGPSLFDDDAYWALPEEVTFEHEAEIRHRLRTLGKDNYEIAAAVPLSKGFPPARSDVK